MPSDNARCILLYPYMGELTNFYTICSISRSTLDAVVNLVEYIKLISMIKLNDV